MIYRFHRKSSISQRMTAQPKNLHISGKHVGQLFAGKCTDVIWECSKIQRYVGVGFCDVFLQTLCFHRNDGLICRNLGCNFLWRAECYHKCFPLNSSSVPGWHSLSDVNNQGMSPCSTTLMHSSAQDVTKFYLQRLSLYCVLWANIIMGLGPKKENFLFFPIFVVVVGFGFCF